MGKKEKNKKHCSAKGIECAHLVQSAIYECIGYVDEINRIKNTLLGFEEYKENFNVSDLNESINPDEYVMNCYRDYLNYAGDDCSFMLTFIGSEITRCMADIQSSGIEEKSPIYTAIIKNGAEFTTIVTKLCAMAPTKRRIKRPIKTSMGSVAKDEKGMEKLLSFEKEVFDYIDVVVKLVNSFREIFSIPDDVLPNDKNLLVDSYLKRTL